MMRKSIKMYLKSIKRSKISFSINFLGLATGLACTFLIFLWVRDEMHVDKFHENDSRLSQVMFWYKMDNGTENTIANLPGLLADALSENIPAVEKAAAVLNSTKVNTLSIDDNGFKAKGIYAGKDFFELFSFDIIEGSKSSLLTDVSNIVISEELALKLFGTTEDIVGKFVEYEKKEQFLVSGVFEKIPAGSTLQFDFVLSLPVFEQHTGIDISWNEYMANTILRYKK